MVSTNLLLSAVLVLCTLYTTNAQSCGCNDCTDQVLASPAVGILDGDFATCRGRIDYLVDELGMNEIDACLIVAGSEFPVSCKGCNPNRCDGRNIVATPAPTIAPLDIDPLQPESDLYCFPSYNNRKRFTNVWNGGYTVEVKRGQLCGPSDNNFVDETVSLDNNELKLEFRKIGSTFAASEVRVYPTNNYEPYSYGTYKWSVKSVRVMRNGVQVADRLPKSLVFGMFTFDVFERYELQENFNHEVDIELGQFNIDGGRDAQFLVQPPEELSFFKFYSGGSSGFDQSGHTWEFTWNPTSIDWSTTANGGTGFSLTTELALEYGLPDRIQCLPSNVDVRINLWSLDGTAGLENDDDVVEVIVDDFSYTPNFVIGVSEGQVCSKHCQCSNDMYCINNICTITDSPYIDGTLPVEDPADEKNPALCANHALCSGLAGACCPTDNGDYLGCCGDVPSAPNGSTCAANSGCAGLSGDCCPTPDGVFLSCCNDSSSADSTCAANSGCAGLSGDCCPTPDGIVLDCCNVDSAASINDVRMCSSHAQCAGLQGNCCPTDDGTLLDCCSS